MKLFYYLILIYLASAFLTDFYTQVSTKSTTEPPISSFVEAWQKLSITQSPPKDTPFDLQKANTIDTLILSPKAEDWWTGHVYKVLNNYYTDVNGEITVGSSALLSKYRGYAKFDISSIPQNAKIQNVEIVVLTTTVSNSPSHSILIKSLK